MILTFFEIITLLSFLGAILAVWIDARLRLNTLEIKIKNIEEKFGSHCQENDEDVKEIFIEIKELFRAHTENMDKIKHDLTELKISVSKAAQK